MFGFGYNNGNIGIGTLQPQYNFDVSGNVHLTGDLYRDNLKIASLNSYLVKKVFIVSTMGMVFDLSYNGIIYLEQTEVEVFVNGYKLAYIDSINKDFDIVLEHDTNNNWTNFTVTLENNVLVGDVVDIIITPGLKFTTESPSLYQIGGLLGTIASPINGGTVNINISLVTNALIELSYGNNPLTINIIPSIFDTHIVGKRGRIYIRERSTNGRVLTIDNRIYFSSLYQPGGTSLASINPLIDILEYEVIKSDLIVGRYEKHTSAYTWDDVNKRLGIGIINPQYPLHVIGDTRIQGNLIVNGTTTMVDTNVNTTEMLDITNDGTGPALRVTQTGAQPIADFCDDLSTNVVLRIADGGNVGIGTTLPCKKLEVAGDISCNFLYGHVSWTDVSGSPMQEIPVGTVVVVDSSATILDETYIPVNGQTLNRVDYPELANSFNIPSGQATFTIPTTSQYQSDWHQSNTSKVTYIKNKPNIVGDGNGNVIVNNISAGNLGMFRNRIINGDMRIDQRNTGNGIGGLTGSYLTYNIQPSSFYTIDRFSIVSPNVGALTAKQVILNDSDKVAVGGGFTNAVEIGLVPKDGLSIYMPFEGNANDIINNSTSTITGTPQYVNASVIGSYAMYLANEANVIATPTKASNYLTFSSINITSVTTISFWMLCTKIPLSGQYSQVFSAGLSNGSGDFFNLQIVFDGTMYICTNSQATSTSTITINRWYHIIGIWIPGSSLSFYVNGLFIGISSITQTGFTNGFIRLGESMNTSHNRAFAGIIDDFRVYNRALSATEIAALATSVGIPAAPATTVISGLTTQLTFDNTTVDAQSGITYSSGTAVYTPVCKVGTSSLDLMGNTAGAASGTAIVYTMGSTLTLPMTISYWFNVSSATSYQVPFSITGANGNWVIHQEINATNTGFRSFINGTEYTPSYFSYAVGTWILLTITYTPSGYLNIYYNGVIIRSLLLTSSTSFSGNSATTPFSLRIGSQSSAAYYFKGIIDDVRIYNRALSSQEVVGLYASSQYASYSLFQQTIEGNNLSDLGWGTSSVQPITASMWIKNNSSNSQQFSIAANNTSMLAWIDFEGGSYADKLGFLTNATLVGSGSISTSTYKIGSAAFDLTANNINNQPSTFINYNIPTSIQLPFSVSLWMNTISVSGSYSIPFCLGIVEQSTSDKFSTQLVMTTNRLYVDIVINGTNYTTTTSSSTEVATNLWYHVCYTVSSSIILYINGIQVAINSGLPINGVMTHFSSFGLCNLLRLGSQTSLGSYAFKGYIDDVRIYNRVLSAEQVRQLYVNNANSTTSSTYLIPRSVVYNTPSIPANSWQKVSVIIPGDTSGNWMTNTDAGLTLSLCLGSTALYNTTNVANTTGNAVTVWNNTPEYMGNSVQLYGSSSNNLLSSVNNSVYVTGWQLERGSIMTTFDIRPFQLELQLCQRYYDKSFSTKTIPSLYNAAGIFQTIWCYSTNNYVSNSIDFSVPLRVIPENLKIILYPVHGSGGTSGQVSVYQGSWLTRSYLIDQKDDKRFYINGGGTQSYTVGSAFLAFQYTVDVEL